MISRINNVKKERFDSEALNRINNASFQSDLSFNSDLFKCIYELDANQDPPRYLIKSWDKIINNYDDRKDSNLANLINSYLSFALKSTAKICKDEGLFNQEEYERYIVSGRGHNSFID